MLDTVSLLFLFATRWECFSWLGVPGHRRFVVSSTGFTLRCTCTNIWFFALFPDAFIALWRSLLQSFVTLFLQVGLINNAWLVSFIGSLLASFSLVWVAVSSSWSYRLSCQTSFRASSVSVALVLPTSTPRLSCLTSVLGLASVGINFAFLFFVGATSRNCLLQ